MPTLYVTGVVAGNAADTTEDIMQTYTVPALTLANVGDILEIVAGGAFGGTTDAKTARLRIGGIAGSIVCAPTGNSASQTRWAITAWVVKTGASTQSFTGLGAISAAATGGSLNGTATLTDTATIQIVVTGQNATNSVVNSVTCQYLHVRYVH